MINNIGNDIQLRLPYNYAKINLSTGQCVGCKTYSYEINNTAYIPVPYISNDYLDKYYSFDTDLWYVDAAMTIEATEVNAMYHG